MNLFAVIKLNFQPRIINYQFAKFMSANSKKLNVSALDQFKIKNTRSYSTGMTTYQFASAGKHSLATNIICREVEIEGEKYKKMVTYDNQTIVISSIDQGWSTMVRDEKLKKQMLFDSEMVRFLLDDSFLPEFKQLLDSTNNWSTMFMSVDKHRKARQMYANFMGYMFGISYEDLPKINSFKSFDLDLVPTGTAFRVIDGMETSCKTVGCANYRYIGPIGRSNPQNPLRPCSECYVHKKFYKESISLSNACIHVA